MLLNRYIEQFSLHEYPVFTLEDRVGTVLDLLGAQGRSCAPVLDGGKPVGLVTLAGLLAHSGSRADAGLLPLSSVPHSPLTTAGLHDHLLDVYSKAASARGEILAVVDHDGYFTAVIEKNRLAREVAALFHLGSGECATIEIEVPSSGIRLSEILDVFEKNDAYIPAFGTAPSRLESESTLVCFRVQTHDLYRLVANLGKYGYNVRYASPTAGSAEDELREKALEFIRFMDM